ncbi:chemotaxis protein CheW [Paucibacter soli]|uniref:chemotaxis protein CheW n=1 Tax=Paucibacter soli TaxID=3133433 RepID=UPI00309F9D5E
MTDNFDQLLTFVLGSESNGVALNSVQEIRHYEAPTKLVSVPAALLGVIHLRDVKVPVLDLRAHFGMGTSPVTSASVIIVFLVDGRNVGILVDAVSDVVDVGPEQQRSVPEMVKLVDTLSLQCIAATELGMVLMLNHRRLIQKSCILSAQSDCAEPLQLEAA